jgi:hypothetical protein
MVAETPVGSMVIDDFRLVVQKRTRNERMYEL